MNENSQSGRVPDEVIRQHIVEGLHHDPGLDSSKMHVEVENGKAILKGKADTEKEKQLAETISRAVPGVTAVENHLHVEIGIIHALTSIAAHIQGDIIKDDEDK
jgi:osmotically-inducible protein OsmY